MGIEVTRAMQDLSMAGGRFDAQMTAAEPSARGVDKVEFMVAGHKRHQRKALEPRRLRRRAGPHQSRHFGDRGDRDSGCNADL